MPLKACPRAFRMCSEGRSMAFQRPFQRHFEGISTSKNNIDTCRVPLRTERYLTTWAQVPLSSERYPAMVEIYFIVLAHDLLPKMYQAYGNSWPDHCISQVIRWPFQRHSNAVHMPCTGLSNAFPMYF